MSRSYSAGGNIKPARFVKYDSVEGRVVQATDGSGSHGDRACGISQAGSHLLPWSSLDDGYAAVSGLELNVFEEDDECYLVVGAAVGYGDKLKADSDGRGITAAVTADNVGAEALQVATAANQVIKVKITRNRYVP